METTLRFPPFYIRKRLHSGIGHTTPESCEPDATGIDPSPPFSGEDLKMRSLEREDEALYREKMEKYAPYKKSAPPAYVVRTFFFPGNVRSACATANAQPGHPRLYGALRV